MQCLQCFYFKMLSVLVLELLFNDTATLVGHFVSSPTEREKRNRRASRGKKRIKALTALLGQLSLSVDWENSPELGRKTVSFNPSCNLSKQCSP